MSRMRPNKRNFIGIELPDKEITLCVGHIPLRTSWCLYFDLPGMCYPLAYFTGEREAKECISFLLELGNRVRKPNA